MESPILRADGQCVVGPSAEDGVHVHAFDSAVKRRSPRPKLNRKGMGTSLRLVVLVLLIVIALAIWLSTRIEISAASAGLTTY
jgi:hypothetical protein